jgi:MFS family permease
LSVPTYTPPIGGSYFGLLRRNRDFRLLYLASLISLAGDWFLTVALLDLVLELTGRAALATLVMVMMNLPVFLVAPWAGTQVDKLDRRKLMIFVDLVRTGAALLPLLVTTPERLFFAYAGVCLISVGGAYFEPAADAALPNLVAPEDLGRANALFGSAWGTMMAAGATLGGLVTVYFGRTASFVVNSVSFFVSALLLLAVRAPFSEASPHKKPRESMRESMREALKYTRERPRVLALILGKGGYGFVAGAVALLSVFGQQGLLGGPSGAKGVALLLSARGLGALFGPFVLRLLVQRNELLNLAVGPCIALFGVGYMGLALGHGIWLGAACVFLAHSGGASVWMAASFGLQREVPDALRGRIFALDYGLVTLMLSASSLIAGFGADRFGARPVVMALSGLAVVWAGVWLIFTRHLWRL